MRFMAAMARRIGDFAGQPDPLPVEPRSTRVATLYWALFGFVLLALLAPIWIVRDPGMVDYPNHLARCYILAHYHDSPVWAERYILVRAPRPNLAMELCVVPLERIVPLAASGKIFLSLSALLFALGCFGIGRYACGKPSWLSLPVAFTFYNSTLFWGFANYLFGVGVFLCSFAYWLHIHKRMRLMHLAVCGLLGLACFYAHLSSFVFFAAACCLLALGEYWHERKLAPLLRKTAWILVPCGAMFAYMRHGGQTGRIAWSSASQKLTQLFGPIRAYHPAFDGLAAAVFLVCFAVLFRRAVRRPILIVGLAFLLLYFVLPDSAFTGTSADARFLLPAFVLLALSIAPRWGRAQTIALGVLLAVQFIRQAVVLGDWEKISATTEQVIALGDHLPENARIYAVRPVDQNQPDGKFTRGYIHAIEAWTISHHADIDTFFALAGQQPLEFRHPRCEEIAAPSCLAQYDYVWTYDPPQPTLDSLRNVAIAQSSWNGVVLWRVNRQGR